MKNQSVMQELNRTFRTAFKWSVIAFGFLAFVNLVLVFLASQLDDFSDPVTLFIEQFNFDEEENLATWASSALLTVTAVGCLVLASIRRGKHPAVAALLAVMSLGFLFLSMDDVSDIHGYAENVVSGLPLYDDELDGEDVSLEIMELDSVEEIHEFAQGVLDDYEPDEEELAGEAIDDALGPVFALALACIFAVVFFAPLWRTSRAGNAKYLLACVVVVLLAAVTEYVYHQSGCEEDWCYQLSSLFEESFEFVAIFIFLAYLGKEIFDASVEATPE